MIPIDHYGYVETVPNGFGFLGALFLVHKAFMEKGKNTYQEILVNNAEIWSAKECPLNGEIRVFYLKDDLTYKTAIVDSVHRRGWREKSNKVDAKRLSTVLNEYERIYVGSGQGAVKKSFSNRVSTNGRPPDVKARRESRKRKKQQK